MTNEEPREAHIRVTPPENYIALRIHAAQMDTSVNAIINDAIHEWLERNPLPERTEP